MIHAVRFLTGATEQADTPVFVAQAHHDGPSLTCIQIFSTHPQGSSVPDHARHSIDMSADAYLVTTVEIWLHLIDSQRELVPIPWQPRESSRLR